MLCGINRHVSFHRSKYTSLHIRRPKLRIWCEVQNRVASLLFLFRPDKGVGQNLEKFSGLLVIVLAVLVLFGLRVGVSDKTIHLITLLAFWNKLAIS